MTKKNVVELGYFMNCPQVRVLLVPARSSVTKKATKNVVIDSPSSRQVILRDVHPGFLNGSEGRQALVTYLEQYIRNQPIAGVYHLVFWTYELNSDGAIDI